MKIEFSREHSKNRTGTSREGEFIGSAASRGGSGILDRIQPRLHFGREARAEDPARVAKPRCNLIKVITLRVFAFIRACGEAENTPDVRVMARDEFSMEVLLFIYFIYLFLFRPSRSSLNCYATILHSSFRSTLITREIGDTENPLLRARFLKKKKKQRERNKKLSRSSHFITHIRNLGASLETSAILLGLVSGLRN